MNLGGTEKSFLNLISTLNIKYKITLLLLEEKGELLNEIPKNVEVKFIDNAKLINKVINNTPIQNIKHELLNRNIILALSMLLNYLLFKTTNNSEYLFKPLKNYLTNTKSDHYDIAIAFAGPHEFISYFTIKHVKATKKIQWIHFDVLKIKLNKKFGKLYYPKFDIINCVSKNAQKEMQQLFPEIKDKISVFRNLVNKKEIIELSNKAESFTDDYKGVRILTLGRLYKEKGQQLIPDAVLELKNRGYDFKWYCIGEGTLRPELEKAIQFHNLRDNLILLGTKKNPYPFIKDCDIYVQTSLHEGYGLTLHEARIINKPIVSTKFKGVEEQINDGFNGVLVEISSHHIAIGIKRLLDDINLRNQLIKNSSNQVFEQSSIEQLL